MGQYRERKIHQVDPETGAILRTIESDRFVTGVTWIDGELWHGTWEGDESELRRIDPRTGEVLERLEMPPGVGVSGSSPMAAISSPAEEEQRKGGQSDGPSEASRHAAAPRSPSTPRATNRRGPRFTTPHGRQAEGRLERDARSTRREFQCPLTRSSPTRSGRASGNKLLKEEKALTKRRDALTAKLRAMPWAKIKEDEAIETLRGKRSLVGAFEGSLAASRLPFHAGVRAGKKGCPSCSYWADHFGGLDYHLPHRDVAFKVISRARSRRSKVSEANGLEI